MSLYDNPYTRWNKEIIGFVNQLKTKYENSILESQFDAQKKVIELVDKIGNEIIAEIDAKYNSDMSVFRMINDCFKNQSKIYHAFVDFVHDFGIINGKRSLYY